MLFTPEAHEAVTDEPWSAERTRAAIASIVADTENAFDDGWPLHPVDTDKDDDPAMRFRTVYLIAANAHDERCELMWGSPGTILAGRELGST
jgi:hypothetical protein